MLTDEQKQAFRNIHRDGLTKFLWGHVPGVSTLLPLSPPELACVYALEMSDGTVKIGVTTNLEKRMKAIEAAVYLKVLRFHHTELAPSSFMYRIENRCHTTFESKRVRGEFFDITFEEACAELDSYADEIAAALKAADENFLDEVEYYEELKAELEAKPAQSNADSVDRYVTKAIELASTNITENICCHINSLANTFCEIQGMERSAAITEATALIDVVCQMAIRKRRELNQPEAKPEREEPNMLAGKKLIANDGHFTTVTDENGLLLAAHDFTTAADAKAAANMVHAVFFKAPKALNIFDCSPKLAATFD